MKRSLWIPALCCLSAFASTYVTYHQAGGRDGTTPATIIQPSAPALSPTGNQSEATLLELRDDYLQRWKTWEEGRYAVLSRAAPRHIAPASAELVLTPESNSNGAKFVLASFVIRQRNNTTMVPCVVDSAKKQVRLFQDGKWLTSDDWLKLIPASS